MSRVLSKEVARTLGRIATVTGAEVSTIVLTGLMTFLSTKNFHEIKAKNISEGGDRHIHVADDESNGEYDVSSGQEHEDDCKDKCDAKLYRKS